MRHCLETSVSAACLDNTYLVAGLWLKGGCTISDKAVPDLSKDKGVLKRGEKE